MVYENISSTWNICTSIEDPLTVEIFKNSFEFCHFEKLPFSLVVFHLPSRQAISGPKPGK